MITRSGKRIFPNTHQGFVEGEAPTLEDVAIGLSRQSRFAGQTEEFYTVLCHSLACAEMGGDFALDLLLHDAAEAIISDVPTTWKPDVLKAAELDIMSNLYESLHLTWPFPKFKRDEIDIIDYVMLISEAHVLGHAAADEYWPLDALSDDMKVLIDKGMAITQRHLDAGRPIWFIQNPHAAISAFVDEFEVLR